MHLIGLILVIVLTIALIIIHGQNESRGVWQSKGNKGVQSATDSVSTGLPFWSLLLYVIFIALLVINKYFPDINIINTIKWLGIILILVPAGAKSFFAWVNCKRRSRIILDTPASRIVSAAQGYVQLAGQAKPTYSQLTVWSATSCSVSPDKHTFLEPEVSNDLILIDDGSGQCYIDPEGAEIITRHKEKRCAGGYRFTEYTLSTLDTLYVIGNFNTLNRENILLDGSKEDLNGLLNEWKQDKGELLARFDCNKDGQIDLKEWEQAVQIARNEVAKQHREMSLKEDVPILKKPADGKLFLISNVPRERLLRENLQSEWLHLLTFFGAVGGTAYLLLKV